MPTKISPTPETVEVPQALPMDVAALAVALEHLQDAASPAVVYHVPTWRDRAQAWWKRHICGPVS